MTSAPLSFQSFSALFPKSNAISVACFSILLVVSRTVLRRSAGSFLSQSSLAKMALGIMPLSTTVTYFVTVKNFEPPITMMLDRQISCVPVTQQNKPIGVLTSTDLMMSFQCALQVLAKLAAELQAPVEEPERSDSPPPAECPANTSPVDQPTAPVEDVEARLLTETAP